MSISKYSHLQDEILELIDNDPNASNLMISKQLEEKYGTANVKVNGLRRYVATLRYLNSMVTVREDYDGNGNLIKQTKIAIPNNQIEVPDDWRPVKIKNYGHNNQSVTWMPPENEATDEVDFVNLVNSIANDLVGTTPPPPPLKREKALIDTLIVYLSDKHVGCYTNGEDVYVTDISHKEKMAAVKSYIQNLYNFYGAFKKVIICDLGDALDGYNEHTVRGGHRLKQNMNNKEQVNNFIDEESDLMKFLVSSGIAANYEYYIVVNDNHSGDFTYSAVYAFTMLLNKLYPNVKAEILEDFLNPVNIGGGQLRVLTHGKDKSARKRGLPYTLDTATEMYLLEWLRENDLDRNKDVRIIKGDLHQSGYQEGKFFTYINVPALVGDTSYVSANFGKSHPAFYYECIVNSEVIAQNFVKL